MIKLILTLLLLLYPTIGLAQLYLAVDFDPIVEEYMIEFDGSTYGPMIPFSIDTQDVRIMDIEPLIIIDQQHTVRAAAVNAWGDVSEWSVPFDFMLTTEDGVVTRQIPQAPVTLRLLSN